MPVSTLVRALPLLLVVLAQTRLAEIRAQGRDRGDVPGWVLITLMTAGIVTVLWAFAGPRLLAILTNALNSVSGPGGSA
ncbi:MAG TPA: hypothetical protein VM433_08520 [Mycobacteriales bacterium]|nr:hypothetical protein [Mycobacteriales bacterium]